MEERDPLGADVIVGVEQMNFARRDELGTTQRRILGSESLQ